jgi:ERCC4-type nuclease
VKGVLRILSCSLDATNFEIINPEISHFLQIRLFLTMKTKANFQTNLYKLLLIGQKVSIKIDEFLKRMYYSIQIYGGMKKRKKHSKKKSLAN